MTLGHELKVLDSMNKKKKKKKVVDDMNDFGSRAQGSRGHEQLGIVVDMTNYRL